MSVWKETEGPPPVGAKNDIGGYRLADIVDVGGKDHHQLPDAHCPSTRPPLAILYGKGVCSYFLNTQIIIKIFCLQNMPAS